MKFHSVFSSNFESNPTLEFKVSAFSAADRNETHSIVSLRSWSMVKMLTVLASTISNSKLFLLRNLSCFCKCKSYSHFFSKNTSTYAIFNDQIFSDILTNDMVSFEQLGPEIDSERKGP